MTNCSIVANVIDTLKAYGAIAANVTTPVRIQTSASSSRQADFEGVTDPTYLLTVDDTVVSP